MQQQRWNTVSTSQAGSDIFSDPNNYTSLQDVDLIVWLGLKIFGHRIFKDNLYVHNDIKRYRTVLGTNDSNSIYVGNNQLGYIFAQNGDNHITIAGKSEGSIIAGNGNDHVRICQNALGCIRPFCYFNNIHCCNGGHGWGHGGGHGHGCGHGPGGGHRQFSLCNTFFNDGQLALKGGDDELLVGGNIDQSTNLGEGQNYAYFFQNAHQNLIGSEDDDFVTILGNLVKTDHSIIWNLKSGDNSIRIKGTCSAPIIVGDGDDFIIVGNNAQSDCLLSTEGGNDLIFVGGLLSTNISTHEGNDLVIIEGSNQSNPPNINLGNGNDQVIVNASFYGNIYSGNGDDIIIIKSLSNPTNLYIDGGHGNDTLIIDRSPNIDINDLQSFSSNIEKIILNGTMY